jgi:hypothetical protein
MGQVMQLLRARAPDLATAAAEVAASKPGAAAGAPPLPPEDRARSALLTRELEGVRRELLQKQRAWQLERSQILQEYEARIADLQQRMRLSIDANAQVRHAEHRVSLLEDERAALTQTAEHHAGRASEAEAAREADRLVFEQRIGRLQAEHAEALRQAEAQRQAVIAQLEFERTHASQLDSLRNAQGTAGGRAIELLQQALIEQEAASNEDKTALAHELGSLRHGAEEAGHRVEAIATDALRDLASLRRAAADREAEAAEERAAALNAASQAAARLAAAGSDALAERRALERQIAALATSTETRGSRLRQELARLTRELASEQQRGDGLTCRLDDAALAAHQELANLRTRLDERDMLLARQREAMAVEVASQVERHVQIERDRATAAEGRAEALRETLARLAASLPSASSAAQEGVSDEELSRLATEDLASPELQPRVQISALVRRAAELDAMLAATSARERRLASLLAERDSLLISAVDAAEERARAAEDLLTILAGQTPLATGEELPCSVRLGHGPYSPVPILADAVSSSGSPTPTPAAPCAAGPPPLAALVSASAHAAELVDAVRGAVHARSVAVLAERDSLAAENERLTAELGLARSHLSQADSGPVVTAVARMEADTAAASSAVRLLQQAVSDFSAGRPAWDEARTAAAALPEQIKADVARLLFALDRSTSSLLDSAEAAGQHAAQLQLVRSSAASAAERKAASHARELAARDAEVTALRAELAGAEQDLLRLDGVLVQLTAELEALREARRSFDATREQVAAAIAPDASSRADSPVPGDSTVRVMERAATAELDVLRMENSELRRMQSSAADLASTLEAQYASFVDSQEQAIISVRVATEQVSTTRAESDGALAAQIEQEKAGLARQMSATAELLVAAASERDACARAADRFNSAAADADAWLRQFSAASERSDDRARAAIERLRGLLDALEVTKGTEQALLRERCVSAESALSTLRSEREAAEARVEAELAASLRAAQLRVEAAESLATDAQVSADSMAQTCKAATAELRRESRELKKDVSVLRSAASEAARKAASERAALHAEAEASEARHTQQLRRRLDAYRARAASVEQDCDERVSDLEGQVASLEAVVAAISSRPENPTDPAGDAATYFSTELAKLRDIEERRAEALQTVEDQALQLANSIQAELSQQSVQHAQQLGELRQSIDSLRTRADERSAQLTAKLRELASQVISPAETAAADANAPTASP